ncbi:hypothetical protein [Kitasatospora sp. NPDC098663]|uniref:hypothetical protein n=1 Tax=Kitasatospora sp. NPDC098663 TaxID=3364096 RepID=UPI0038010B4D
MTAPLALVPGGSDRSDRSDRLAELLETTSLQARQARLEATFLLGTPIRRRESMGVKPVTTLLLPLALCLVGGALTAGLLGLLGLLFPSRRGP